MSGKRAKSKSIGSWSEKKKKEERNCMHCLNNGTDGRKKKGKADL